MPPKAKFTREEVADKAFKIVQKSGAGALTARSLGEALGCSSRPVFTVFSGMDEVLSSVMTRARAMYTTYVETGLKQAIPFKGVGESYIRFASEQPRLFELLFMTGQRSVPPIESVLSLIEVNYDSILASINSEYGLGDKRAKRLYRHMWIYTHGIATLAVTGICSFTPSEISDMLTEVCKSILIKMMLEDTND